jgi:hypothetical protein
MELILSDARSKITSVQHAADMNPAERQDVLRALKRRLDVATREFEWIGSEIRRFS